MLELASVAPERGQFLQGMVNAKWIPASAKEPIYQQYLSQLQAQVQKSDALARTYAEHDLRNWQVSYAKFLVDGGRIDRAEEVLNSLAKPVRDQVNSPASDGAGADEADATELQTTSQGELEVRLRIAIARNQLEGLIDSYKSHPESAPSIEMLRTLGTALQKVGQRAPARRILEYVFTQEIAEHRLNAANMLGLAEIRIQDGDLPGAMQLLRRLTLVVGSPFENLEPAASLLSRTGHHAEAVEFLDELLKATPWDERIRLKLAQEQLASGVNAAAAQAEAVKVASDAQSTYTDREDAASMVKSRGAASLGSAELDLLAGGNLTTELADKQYFYAARLRAVDKSTPTETKSRLLMNALGDTPDRESARVPLFLTLSNSGRDRLGVSVMQPMLSSNFLSLRELDRYNNQAVVEDEESSATQDDSMSGFQMESALERVTATQKAQVTFLLGKSFVKLGEYQDALRCLRSAKALESSKAVKAEIDQAIASVRKIQQRIATNDERVPIVRAELEQERVVRPRLLEVAKESPKLPNSAAKAPKGGTR
jgi:tetratricopeptide (TPR) repeat protein